MRPVGSALAALAVAGLLSGCGDGSEAPAGGGVPGAPAQRTLTVSAATSLTDVFDRLEARFEADNPGVDVRLNYGASSDLAQQIVNGARADVFAAANTSTMDTVSRAGLVTGTPAVLVTNKLEIAVAPGNPKGVAAFADLARPGLKVVVCAPQVPCGSATDKVEKATGVALEPVSEEPDVRSVLGKVTSGDADAGLVYVTDVRSTGGKVTGVGFPEADKAINDYPIAVLKDAPQPELAGRWVELARGDAGKEVLRSAGFGTP